MDARTKALKAHRKRLQARRMKRVEVTVRNQDAEVVRRLAAELRRDDANSERLRSVIRGALAARRAPTLAEALYDPVIAGPEFDDVFEEIERQRRHPAMMKERDLNL